jgi:predicted MPP superfamily phosphohydrolase
MRDVPVIFPDSPHKPAAGVRERPELPSRRNFLRLMAVGALAPAFGVAYATHIEPFWPEFTHHDVQIRGLGRAWDGARIVQLSDLHTGSRVPESYLAHVVGRVNELAPDLVVVTGDLINHEQAGISVVAGILSRLKAPVYASPGNHDYSPSGAWPGPTTVLVDELESRLAAVNIKLLRNASVRLDRGGDPLWLVGLEDCQSFLYKPQDGFANIPPGEPVICLSHSPDTVEDLEAFRPPLVLSGHTHGGQVRVPLRGAVILPLRKTHFDQGWFDLSYGRLYVSRGVGYLMRIRLNCRPEIPIFTVRSGTGVENQA